MSQSGSGSAAEQGHVKVTIILEADRPQFLNALYHLSMELRKFVSSFADLTSAVATLTTEMGELGASVDALVAVVDQLRAGGSLSAADQQALDDAVAAVQSASSGLNAEEDALNTAANPPAPQP